MSVPPLAAAPAGQAFRASWRTPLAWGVAMPALLGAGFLLGAWAADRELRILLAVLGFVCLGVVWLVALPLLDPRPFLTVGPEGIGGFSLRHRVVPWDEVDDLVVDTNQGYPQLVLLLREGAPSTRTTRGIFGGIGRERRIPLTSLPRAQRAQAAGAARAAFGGLGGGRAERAAAERAVQERRAQAVANELAVLTPSTWAVRLVVALNCATWGATWLGGLDPMAPGAGDLFRWGANEAWAVVNRHEAWRLLASTFLHGGAMHLAFNMVGLWSSGVVLNRLYGNLQFLAIYLLSALAGSAASLHFSAQASVSVGASGAVFGVIAALVVVLARHRARLAPVFGSNAVAGQALFLAYALAQGFAAEGIDNAAHVGGFAAGAATAWMLADRLQDSRREGLRFLASVAVVVAAVALGVRTAPAPALDHRAVFAGDATLRRVAPQFDAVQADLRRGMDEHEAGRLGDAALADRMASEYLPVYRRVAADLAGVALAPDDERRDGVADLRQMTESRIALLELQVRMLRGTADADAGARQDALEADLRTVARRMHGRAAARKPG